MPYFDINLLLEVRKIKKDISFKVTLVISALIVTLIPLILSYVFSLNSKLADSDARIKNTLQEVSEVICNDKMVQSKLYNKENDNAIQEYSKDFIKIFDDVDIIVISDMTGKKYSHLDENQIGEIFIGEDKYNVLNYGESYFSMKTGSMGTTFRWFQPIYYNEVQVGFIMTGKYYDIINFMNNKVKIIYFFIFIICLSISGLGSMIFANKIKKAMLNMEPYEIAKLYEEKNILFDSVKDGIIALNKKNEVTEVNKICYKMFENFNVDEVIEKLDAYIKSRLDVEMKEFIINNKKIFVTIKVIFKDEDYLGVIITLTDRSGINKIAKEITGVDEVIKNLRVSVHEFKNNLYVILGLLQLKEYDEATNYILKLQEIEKSNSIKFSNIEDSYVHALLMSRELAAKEKKISLTVSEESFLQENHGIISSFDIVTILGNLLENAFEACSSVKIKEKMVEVSLFEDEEVVEIQVRDNGRKIDSLVKNNIFDEGISSKSEGRGIGLHLVKSRVELYNGNIDIEEFENEKIFVVIIYKGEKNDKSFNC